MQSLSCALGACGVRKEPHHMRLWNRPDVKSVIFDLLFYVSVLWEDTGAGSLPDPTHPPQKK